MFIEAYGLDAKQAVAAREGIHKNIREQAIKYRDKHKGDFEKLDAESRSPDTKNKTQELAGRRLVLERQLREMFMDMDRRLNQLVDTKQRAAVNADRKKQLDAVYESLAGEPRDKPLKDGEPSKLRTVATTSQPAKSSPAEVTSTPTTGPSK